jgi:prophage maintenance system killer protein
LTQQAPEAPPIPPLRWLPVGREHDLIYLSDEQVVAIHDALASDFAAGPDPIAPAGVRSVGLLSSAVSRPQTANGDILKYPTVEMAAAALLHALVHNHPFHNGNKRTALVAMLVFLDENGMMPICEEDEVFRLVLRLAQHALVEGHLPDLPDREVLVIANWLKDRCRWTELGDRPMSFRRLKPLLSEYGCEFEHPPGVGNRINITRVVSERSSWFGRPRQLTLRTQTHYGDEGRDVAKDTIKKIRHDLHLDDDHGVDSASFYQRLPAPPGEFIVRYRKTLRRLARV